MEVFYIFIFCQPFKLLNGEKFVAAIFKALFTKLCPLPGGFNFEPKTLPMFTLCCFAKSANFKISHETS